MEKIILKNEFEIVKEEIRRDRELEYNKGKGVKFI